MDMSINKINFGSKREVMYGLSMAAKEARNAEICRALSQGPRPLNRFAEGKTSEALLNAYMDMSTFDDTFYNSIKDCDNAICDNLKEALKPEKLQFSELNPLRLFKKSMIESLKKHNKVIDSRVLNEFFTKISDKTKYQI